MAFVGRERLAVLKAFDETKAGVKGLFDSGISTLPPIFIHPHSHSVSPPEPDSNIQNSSIPVIDISGALLEKGPTTRKDVVDQVRDAAEKWGFFQVVNHGIPAVDLEMMIKGIRRFFEQDVEVRKNYYSRDYGNRSVLYNSNFDLYTGLAPNWRDSVTCRVAPVSPNPDDLPIAFRDIMTSYSKQVLKLGKLLLELLSEALGLKSNHLDEIGCCEELSVVGHYYPPCPQPELAMGIARHTDIGFITILLQDQLGGLQILHDDQWINVDPIPGALAVNIADLLQLLTNDKFKSAEHKVPANSKGPRISVASLFRGNPADPLHKTYEPIKELLSVTNPPKYGEITAKEYYTFNRNKGLNGVSSLNHFRL